MGIEFSYMLLDRYKSDCLYFLGYGNNCEKHLYYHNVEKHIKEMKKLYFSLPVKPEWLTLKDINKLAKKMKKAKYKKMAICIKKVNKMKKHFYLNF